MIHTERARTTSEAQAPGKLYIAGEYAVVEAGHPAILVAVNRYITARISEVPSGNHGHIHSQGHPEAEVSWQRDADGECVSDEHRPAAAFILEAIRTVDEVARAAGVQPRLFDTRIVSELDDDSGRKYGLGSSAAVTVAAIQALLGFYGLELEPLERYKIAFIASSRAQRVGSGGDLAASLYGGCIRFCAVDRAWVRKRLLDTDVASLITMPWPKLSISRLRAFDEGQTAEQADPAMHGSLTGQPVSRLRLLVGWSGRPASTEDLVTQVRRHNPQDQPERFAEFLKSSDQCVDALAEALTRGDMDGVRTRVGEARTLLQGLSSLTGTPIETAELTTLITLAIAHGAAAKTSGAGGGDCGIAILERLDEADALRDDWKTHGIAPLGLSVCQPLADTPPWQDRSSQRKDDHVRLALHQHEHEGTNAFDDVRFIHHGLRGVSLSRVDTSVTICGKSWTLPFYINAMTGGSRRTAAINRSLSRVAGATGLAMASGSQHAALRNPSLAPTFTVIREHTSGFVFANVGPTVSPEQADEAVRMLRADALQIHINLAQEIVMPEGNRDFSTWPARIRAIAQRVTVPVVVKEVGFGMSRATIDQLASLGITMVDVSGRGGTDFAAIENARRASGEYSYLDQWGQSTVLCLLESLNGPHPVTPVVLASGGVRSPLDVVKALALGARAVGVSGHFLHVLSTDGEQGLIDEIGRWGEQLRSLMALLGSTTVEDLRHTDLLLGGTTANYAATLGVDASALARRSVRQPPQREALNDS